MRQAVFLRSSGVGVGDVGCSKKGMDAAHGPSLTSPMHHFTPACRVQPWARFWVLRDNMYVIGMPYRSSGTTFM